MHTVGLWHCFVWTPAEGVLEGGFLQNMGLSCGVEQDPCWFTARGDLQPPGKTPAKTGIEGVDSQKSAKVEHSVSKVGRESSCCVGTHCAVSTIVCVSRLGGREGKLCPPALLFLVKSPKDPCPPAQALLLVNKSLSHKPQAFLKLLLLCYISTRQFVMLSLKVRDSVSHHPLPSQSRVHRFLRF